VAVDGCVGETLAEEELPNGDLATLYVESRSGLFRVGTGPRLLLRCTPADLLPRGAFGVGALFGAAAFDNLTISR
jgi:hypothetical protein